MKQTTMQDKGVSSTAAVSENLKSAAATVQENFEKAGATVAAQVDKVKAGGDGEACVEADLTKDKRQVEAADRAEEKKAEAHAQAAGQRKTEEQHHPEPFTKTPFV